jgi:hypothetical protein
MCVCAYSIYSRTCFSFVGNLDTEAEQNFLKLWYCIKFSHLVCNSVLLMYLSLSIFSTVANWICCQWCLRFCSLISETTKRLGDLSNKGQFMASICWAQIRLNYHCKIAELVHLLQTIQTCTELSLYRALAVIKGAIPIPAACRCWCSC